MSEAYKNSSTTATQVDTERTLLVKILQVLNGLNLGGGGGGTGAVFGNYHGGQPTFTPATGNGLAVDTSNGTLWEYYNGAWH